MTTSPITPNSIHPARSAPRSASASTCTKPAAPSATDDEIDAAILTALADAGGADRPVRWKSIERRIPGTAWQQEMALVRLWQAWRIYAVKVRGCTVLSLANATDALIAANNLATGPRVLPVVV